MDAGRRNVRIALGMLGGAVTVGAALLAYDELRGPSVDERRAERAASDRAASERAASDRAASERAASDRAASERTRAADESAEVEEARPSPASTRPSPGSADAGLPPRVPAGGPASEPPFGAPSDATSAPAVIGAPVVRGRVDDAAPLATRVGDAAPAMRGDVAVGGGPAAVDETSLPGPPVATPLTDAAPRAEVGARAPGPPVARPLQDAAVDRAAQPLAADAPAPEAAPEAEPAVEDAAVEDAAPTAEAAAPIADAAAAPDAGPGGATVPIAEVGIAEIGIADVGFGVSSGLVYDEAGAAYDPNVPTVVGIPGGVVAPGVTPGLDGTGTLGGVTGTGAFDGLTGAGAGTSPFAGGVGQPPLAGGIEGAAAASPAAGGVIATPSADIAGGTLPGGTTAAGGAFGTPALTGTGTGTGTGGFGGLGGVGGLVGDPFGMFAGSPFAGAGGVWTFVDGVPDDDEPATETPTGFTANVLVPLGSADPATVWPAIAPNVRSGDLVVAFVPTASSTSLFLGFSERVASEAPGAIYVVAVPTVDALASAAGAVPATLGGLGLTDVAGLDDATLAEASARVRAVGKRFFVSVSTSATSSFATIGARADLVEVVPVASDAAGAVEAARPAIEAIRAAGNPIVFVRIPAAVATASLSTAASTIASGLPGVGVALPAPSTAPDLLDGLR